MELNHTSSEIHSNFFDSTSYNYDGIIPSANFDSSEEQTNIEYISGVSLILTSFSLLEVSSMILSKVFGTNTALKIIGWIGTIAAVILLTIGIINVVIEFPDINSRIKTSLGLFFAAAIFLIFNSIVSYILNKGMPGSSVFNFIKILFNTFKIAGPLLSVLTLLSLIIGLNLTNFLIIPAIILNIILIFLALRLPNNIDRRIVFQLWKETSAVLFTLTFVYLIIVAII